MFRKTALTLAAIMVASAAMADDITISDAYARSAGSMAKAGAAFMVIENHTDTDDRLVSVASPASVRVELHTHIEDATGLMRMVEVEDGFPVPAGGQTVLKRGGLHVMFMGLKAPFEQDAMVPLTLTFEQAGDLEIEVPVDLERKPMGGHGGHGHGHGHTHGSHSH